MGIVPSHSHNMKECESKDVFCVEMTVYYFQETVNVFDTA